VLFRSANATTTTLNGIVSFTGGIQEATPLAPNVSGTFAPNPNLGTMLYVTLAGNFTFNGFNSTVNNQGKSMTIVFKQDATGNRVMTSTSSNIKWAGGEKTLSTAGNSFDVVTIFFDGNFYYASLVKGFV
jgi:hypothetical protein